MTARSWPSNRFHFTRRSLCWLGFLPFPTLGCHAEPLSAEKRTPYRVLNVDLRDIPPDDIPVGKFVFSSEQGWRDFFNRFATVPDSGIDWSTEIIGAVFLGAQPSPGYRVEVESVARVSDRQGSRTVVKVVEVLPNPNLGYAAEVTYPRLFVAVRRQAGPVLFCSCQRIDRK